MSTRTIACLLLGVIAGATVGVVGSPHAAKTAGKPITCGTITLDNRRSIGIEDRLVPYPAPATRPAAVETRSTPDPIGCFVAAAAHCAPATLRYDIPMGIDTGASYTLEVTGGSRSCVVTETETSGLIWAPLGPGPATSAQCTSVRKHGSGIVLEGCTNTIEIRRPDQHRHPVTASPSLCP